MSEDSKTIDIKSSDPRAQLAAPFVIYSRKYADEWNRLRVRPTKELLDPAQLSSTVDMFVETLQALTAPTTDGAREVLGDYRLTALIEREAAFLARMRIAHEVLECMHTIPDTAEDSKEGSTFLPVGGDGANAALLAGICLAIDAVARKPSRSEFFYELVGKGWPNLYMVGDVIDRESLENLQASSRCLHLLSKESESPVSTSPSSNSPQSTPSAKKPRRSPRPASGRLTDKQRENLEAFRSKSMNIQQVAEFLGRDRKTVYESLESAHRKLGITFCAKKGTRRLPFDKRGQPIVYAPENRD